MWSWPARLSLRVMDELRRARRPLDDDELARRCLAPRHPYQFRSVRAEPNLRRVDLGGRHFTPSVSGAAWPRLCTRCAVPGRARARCAGSGAECIKSLVGFASPSRQFGLHGGSAKVVPLSGALRWLSPPRAPG